MDSGRTALYRIYDADDVLLYIGVSKNFGLRWQQHAQKQPWWNDRQRMTIDLYNTRDEALDAEALAIFAERPKYNIVRREQTRRLKKMQRAAMKAAGEEKRERHLAWCQQLANDPEAAKALGDWSTYMEHS